MTTPAGMPTVAVNIQQDSQAASQNIITFDGTTQFNNTRHFAGPYWGVDQTNLWRSLSISRGSSDPTDPMFHANTGTASVVLDNRTRKFDPISNTDVRPGIGIQNTATWGSGLLLSSDTFNRANGSLGNTDGAGLRDPKTWNVISITGGTSGITIVSNQAKSGSNGATRTAATLDLLTADVAIQAQPSTSGVQAGVVGRLSDGNNFWALRIDTSVGSKWVLEKWQSGSSSTPITLSNNTASNGDTGILTMTGSTITAQKLTSGGSLITMGTGTNTFNQNQTTHGILCWEALAPIDNWSASATSDVPYPLFSGFIDKWPVSYAQRGSDSTVSIQANDAQELFNNTTVTDPLPSELTSTRVKRLLNHCNWPTYLRTIGVGQSKMNATTNTSNNAWSAFLECADSEMGELYVDASGYVVFRDRLSITTDSRSITSQATFGDAGGSEIPFSDVTISNDLARIRNDIQVTFNESNGVAHASDRKSQLTYGGVGGTPRTYTITVSLPSQRAANAMANYLLFLYKDQQTTIDQIVLKPAKAPTHWPDVLARELGDRITVKLTPPGGGSRISRDCIIRGIKHDLSNNDWTTTWTLQDTYAFDSSKFIKFDGATKFDGTKTWWY